MRGQSRWGFVKALGRWSRGKCADRLWTDGRFAKTEWAVGRRGKERKEPQSISRLAWMAVRLLQRYGRVHAWAVRWRPGFLPEGLSSNSVTVSTHPVHVLTLPAFFRSAFTILAARRRLSMTSHSAATLSAMSTNRSLPKLSKLPVFAQTSISPRPAERTPSTCVSVCTPST